MIKMIKESARMEKMKLLLALLAVCSVFLATGVAPGASADTAILRMAVLKYEPYPTEPGKYFDLWIKVENTGTKDADNVLFVLMPKYPFSLDNSETASRSIGKLWALQQTILQFKVKVDENAVEGSNTLDMKYQTTDGSWITNSADILVKARSAVLEIESIGSEPYEIEPGKSAVISVKMKNIASTTISDVTATLDFSAANLPFAPINSTAERRVKQLDAGNEVTLKFDMISLANAESSVYKVPMSIEYYDRLGAKYVKSDVIGLIVSSKPRIEVGLDTSDIVKSGSVGEIVIRLVNRGLMDVKFVNLKLLPDEKYELLSSDTVYIGNLNSDDYDTAKFKIFVENTTDKLVKMPVLVSYMDANNRQHDENLDVSLKLYDLKEITSMGLEKQNNQLQTLAVAAVVIVVVYIAYRAFRKKP